LSLRAAFVAATLAPALRASASAGEQFHKRREDCSPAHTAGAGRTEKRRPRNDSSLFLKTYDELLGNLHFDRSTLILDLMSGLIIPVLILSEGMTYAG
jgi:hypothetical protein